jgi:hypothetical protein
MGMGSGCWSCTHLLWVADNESSPSLNSYAMKEEVNMKIIAIKLPKFFSAIIKIFRKH